ncbi:MAG: M56 family metallopeptidase [Pseudomonadota bacterium]
MMMIESLWTMPPLAWLALKSVVWLALICLAARCMRHASAATKAGVWAAGLFGLLLLPVLTQVLPRWELAAPRAPTPMAVEVSRSEPAEPAASFSQVHIDAVTVAPPAEPVPPPVAQSVVDPSGPSLQTMLSLVWAFGAAGLLVRLLRAWRATTRLAAAATATASAGVLAGVHQVRRRMGLRRQIAVRLSDMIAVPVTFGVLRPQLLLPSEANEWTEQRLAHVLAHELAHVRRHDWAVQLLGTVVRALYWFNPLVWIACSEWHRQAELASDDHVIDHGAPATDYAGDLVAVARALRERMQPTAACVAMVRRSELAERVDALLDDERERGAPRAPWAVAALLGGLTVGLPLSAFTMVEGQMAQVEPPPEPLMPVPAPEPTVTPLPVVEPIPVVEPVPAVEPHMPSRGRTRMTYEEDGFRLQLHREDELLKLDWRDDDEQVEVRLEGNLQLSEDDRDVLSVSPGGSFELKDRVGRERRAITLTPDTSGRLERRYLRNGKVAPWDTQAQQWFVGRLLQVLRNGGLDAEGRVQRLLARGGTAAVLDEVRQITFSHVASEYLAHLIAYTDLSVTEAQELLAVAGERVTSDHSLANLLIALSGKIGLPQPLHLAYLQAVMTIASDHESGRVLARLLREELDEPALMAVMDATATIASDHEAAMVLAKVPERYTLSTQVRAAYLRNVKQVQSDHEQSMLLLHLLRQPLGPEQLTDVLEAAESLQSDHELSMVLIAALRNQTLSGESLQTFANTAASLQSDHEMATVLIAMLRQSPVDAARSVVALELLHTVASDSSAADVLSTVLRERTLGDDEWRAFLRVYPTINSSSQQGRLLDVLLMAGALETPRVMDVLRLIDSMSSSSTAVEALRRLARTQRLDDRSRARYREVAEGLSGDRSRQAALEALNGASGA